MGKLLNYTYFNKANYKNVTDIYNLYKNGSSGLPSLNTLITKSEFTPLYTGRLTSRNLWEEYLYSDDSLVDSWVSRYRISIHIKCTGTQSFETDWNCDTLSGTQSSMNYRRNDVFHYSRTVTLNIILSNLKVWDKTETNVFDDTTKLSTTELIDRGFDLSWHSFIANTNYPITSSSDFSCNISDSWDPTPAGYYPQNTQYSSGWTVGWGFNNYANQWLFTYTQNVHRNGST